MKREDVLAEMKDCIGKQDPIVFFDKMVGLFTILFDRIDELQGDLKQAKIQSALAIQWEPRLASSMISQQIEVLRQDRDTYQNEISLLKKAFVEDRITQNYKDFCDFWQDTLGWHPFLDYDK